jgi:glycine/D-amino acid oxidase-like deaminating enzyme
MQNDPQSHGLWEMTAPAAPFTGPLQGDLAVDVAIVGAGYTGLSAALHLAEAGRSVAVLEAVEIGFGGAGRNVGLVNAGMWVMPDALIDCLGESYGTRLLSLLGQAPREVFDLIARHQIACEVVRRGTLHCASGASGLRQIEARAAQWRKHGVALSLLSAAETAEKTGSAAYAGALLDLRAGTIQPLAYARGLAQAALRAGARIYTQSPVTALDQGQGKPQLRTPMGRVTAGKVILATDAYTRHLHPEIRASQVMLPYFNFATQPLPEEQRRGILPEGQGAWDTRDILTSFRMDAAGRLVLGSVGALRGAGRKIHRDWATRALRHLFPQLGAVAFEAAWYGQIGMTADNLPRLHRFGPDVIGTCGYNGRGIAPGTVFGRILAEHLTGSLAESELPLPVTEISQPMLGWAREAVIELGAQAAHLAGHRM